MNQKMYKRGFTHNTVFHADDVFATALCKILFGEDFEVIRGAVVPEHFDGLVYDIGRGKFDHHQLDRAVRADGNPYAAFGLLWKEFGERLVAKEDVEKFDKRFIEAMDKIDNFGGKDEFCDMISTMNPFFDEDKSEDEAFNDAVEVAKIILNRAIGSINANRRAYSIVKEAVSTMKNNIVVLDKYMPWLEAVVPTRAEFIVFPSNRGGYSAQAVPPSLKKVNQNKVPFPASWAGKDAATLQRISGIKTLNFAHVGRFFIACSTKEDCIKACRLAQQEFYKER